MLPLPRSTGRPRPTGSGPSTFPLPRPWFPLRSHCGLLRPAPAFGPPSASCPAAGPLPRSWAPLVRGSPMALARAPAWR
eukprot:12149418-Alexandrium_andersonii.AAC.1